MNSILNSVSIDKILVSIRQYEYPIRSLLSLTDFEMWINLVHQMKNLSVEILKITFNWKYYKSVFKISQIWHKCFDIISILK